MLYHVDDLFVVCCLCVLWSLKDDIFALWSCKMSEYCCLMAVWQVMTENWIRSAPACWCSQDPTQHHCVLQLHHKTWFQLPTRLAASVVHKHAATSDAWKHIHRHQFWQMLWCVILSHFNSHAQLVLHSIHLPSQQNTVSGVVCCLNSTSCWFGGSSRSSLFEWVTWVNNRFSLQLSNMYGWFSQNNDIWSMKLLLCVKSQCLCIEYEVITRW